jgi:hypothetical protein
MQSSKYFDILLPFFCPDDGYSIPKRREASAIIHVVTSQASIIFFYCFIVFCFLNSLFGLEDGGIALLRSVGIILPGCMSLHPTI